MAKTIRSIPMVEGALIVTIADGEIVIATQHDYASLTPAAARATASRLIEAADELELASLPQISPASGDDGSA